MVVIVIKRRGAMDFSAPVHVKNPERADEKNH
jgi:hypothetical protein